MEQPKLVENKIMINPLSNLMKDKLSLSVMMTTLIFVVQVLSDRIQNIEEQEKSGSLNGGQAAELRQRIKATQNNLEC